MTKEELIAMGIPGEQAEKIATLHTQAMEESRAAEASAKAALEAAQAQLAQRDKDMEAMKKGAKGSEELQARLEELQTRYAQETEGLKKQLADREYESAMRGAVAEQNLLFTSKSAERAFLAELKAKGLEVREGKLSGFEGFCQEYRKTDPEAFAAPAGAARGNSAPPPPPPGRGAARAKSYTWQFIPGAETK